MLTGRRAIAGIAFAFCTLNAAPNVCHVTNDALAPAEIVPGVTVPRCSPDPYPPPPVAQGSIISITGDDLGPIEEETTRGFPLRTNLSGVSVRLTVGSLSVDAFVLSVEHHRIRVMVPSRTPLGEGSLVTGYNGSFSNPYRVQVAPRHFRIYSRSPQALAHNVSSEGQWRDNRFSNPARPGQQMVLWGTGLGAADGDESAGPLPSRVREEEIEVRLGLKLARVLYAGRSGCCPGLDQIVIETPVGIEGCTVPVIVRFPGDYGEPDFGYPTVAVASSGTFCSDPHGMSEAALRLVEANASARIGWVSLGGGGWWVRDGIFATFSRFGAHYALPPGTCGYPRWSPPSNAGSAFWDAGAELTLTGPSGNRAVPHHEDYNAELLGSVYTASFDSGDLPAGSYEIHNGSGGAHVGPFRIAVPIADAGFAWTNRETLSAVRGEDLTFTWTTTGPPEGGFVRISGTFLTFKAGDPNGYGLGGFSCLEQVSKGGFTVPSWMLWPPRLDQADSLDLHVTYFTRREFAAPGLAFGEFVHTRPGESARKPIAQSNR